MTIIEALVQLKTDILDWGTTNFKAKADKITTDDLQDQVSSLSDEHSALRDEFNILKESAVTVFVGTGEPVSTIGEDGDLYLVLEE